MREEGREAGVPSRWRKGVRWVWLVREWEGVSARVWHIYNAKSYCASPWVCWASGILTETGLITCPPRLIGLILEAGSFIITAFVNGFCEAVSFNRLG